MRFQKLPEKFGVGRHRIWTGTHVKYVQVGVGAMPLIHLHTEQGLATQARKGKKKEEGTNKKKRKNKGWPYFSFQDILEYP